MKWNSEDIATCYKRTKMAANIWIMSVQIEFLCCVLIKCHSPSIKRCHPEIQNLIFFYSRNLCLLWLGLPILWKITFCKSYSKGITKKTNMCSPSKKKLLACSTWILKKWGETFFGQCSSLLLLGNFRLHTNYQIGWVFQGTPLLACTPSGNFKICKWKGSFLFWGSVFKAHNYWLLGFLWKLKFIAW